MDQETLRFTAEGGPGSGRHPSGLVKLDREKLYDGGGFHQPGSRAAEKEAVTDAIQAYTGTGFIEINSSLRRGAMPREQAKAVAVLDAHMGRTPNDVTEVYRGVPKLPCEMKPGATFQDKAFVSTSTNVAIAKGFLPISQRTGVLIRITNPRAAKGMDLRKVGDRENRKEKEILLARNTRFRVISVSDKIENNYGTHREVAVRIIK